MSAQHTKGPWVVAQNGNWTCVDDAEGNEVADCGTWLGRHDGKDNVIKAVRNAYLIAAAPDLLEALQEIDAMWSGEGGHAHPIHARSGEVREVWKHARAAIAKATS
jgi:hypothetical protein